MTPDERAELLRIIERIERRGNAWMPLNLMALRQLAGQPIDEKERQNLITDLYHREVGYRQRIDLQLERNEAPRKGKSPAIYWFDGNY